MKPAKPDSWNMHPMPEQNSVLDFSAEFTSEEFTKISLGHKPQDMNDMWFIYLDGDQLNFHRSLTGNCIYQIEFSREEGKVLARRVTVNRHPEQYEQVDERHDSKLDSELLHLLISQLLSANNKPFLIPTKYAERYFERNLLGEK